MQTPGAVKPKAGSFGRHGLNLLLPGRIGRIGECLEAERVEHRHRFGVRLHVEMAGRPGTHKSESRQRPGVNLRRANPEALPGEKYRRGQLGETERG